MDNKLQITGIRFDEWINPFGATPEELVAANLDEGGLLAKETKINGKPARELCQNYQKKRDRFQEATRLGTLLVKESLITGEQLTTALAAQKEKSQPIGEILIQLQICSQEEIQAALARQKQLRQEIQQMEIVQSEWKTLWQRLLILVGDSRQKE
jgi:hypothetical protein